MNELMEEDRLRVSTLAEQAKLSFWDALVVVAAARTGATALYTEDLNHGQEILGVRIRNPFISAPPASLR